MPTQLIPTEKNSSENSSPQSWLVATGLPYPTLLDGLSTAIKTRKTDDPFANQTILVPKLSLARPLEKALLERLGGLFGLRVVTPVMFARSLTEQRLVIDGCSILPGSASGAVVAEAIARTLEETTEYCPDATADDPRFRPNFVDAALRAIIDEKRMGNSPDDLSNRALAAIYRASEEILLEGGWLDTTDLLRRASEVLAAEAASPGAVLYVFGFTKVNVAEIGLIESAQKGGWSVQVFLPWLLDAPVFAPAKQFYDSLVSDLGFTPITPPPPPERGVKGLIPRLYATPDYAKPDQDSTREVVEKEKIPVEILSAPNPESESREVVRWILEYLKENEANPADILILHPHLKAVHRLAQDLFSEAGLPLTCLLPGNLMDTPAGRSVFLLLEVIDGGLLRSDVIEWLTLVTELPVLQTSDDNHTEGKKKGRTAPSEWDRLSRLAGIVGGQAATRRPEGEWTGRLEAVRRRLLSGQANSTDEDDTQSEQTALDALMERTALLLEATSSKSFGPSASWRAWIEGVQHIWLGCVPENIEHMEEIEKVFRRLKTYDKIASPPSSSALRRRLVEAALSGISVNNPSKPGNGVQLSELDGVPPGAALVVIVMGLVDPEFPKADVPSPLSSGVGQTIKIGDNNVDAGVATGRLDLALALGSAKEKLVLSYPRTEGDSKPERPPSTALVEVLRAMGPSRNVWSDSACRAAIMQPPNRWIHQQLTPNLDNRTWTCPHEFDLALALHLGQEAKELLTARADRGEPFLRGTSAIIARESSELSKYEGCLGSPDRYSQLTWSGEPAQAPLSPSRLESYARCPFQYFAGYILGLSPIDEPEPSVGVDARRSGDLIHNVLADVMGHFRDSPLPSDEETLKTIWPDVLGWTHDALQKFAPAFGDEPELLWELLKERVESAVRTVIAEGVEDDDFEWLPKVFEVSFGSSKQADTQEDSQSRGGKKWSTSEPGKVPGLEGVSFRGKIDRLDLSYDNKSARIVDYKTGKRPGLNIKQGPFQRGLRLQLAAYILGAETLLSKHAPGVSNIDACYWYIFHDGGGSSRLDLSYSKFREETEELKRILEVITGGMSQGIFPQHPHDVPERGSTCSNCEYQRICGPLPVIAARRAATLGDVATQKLRVMREATDKSMTKEEDKNE